MSSPFTCGFVVLYTLVVSLKSVNVTSSLSLSLVFSGESRSMYVMLVEPSTSSVPLMLSSSSGPFTKARKLTNAFP